jgi:putative aldouronate transport system substrate-binding protein
MKRALVVFMLVAMILPMSLFAEGSKEAAPAAAAELDANGRFLTTRNLTVEIFDRGTDNNRTKAEDNVWTTWIKEKVLQDLNIAVTFVPVPRWTETDVINNQLAAGDAPDICYTYSYNTVLTYAGMGGVMDLNPIIEKNKARLPDLFNLLGDTNVYNNLDPTKKTLWALESMQFHPMRNSVFVREDWLKKLNLKAPKTHAEFEAMLVAFKNNAQTLLGKDADKMIPLSMSVDVGWRADPLSTSFVPDNLKDEELWMRGYDDRRIMWPGYKDGIKYLNKWYNMGLIWKDFPLYPRGDQTFEDNLIRSGYVGCFIHNWDYAYRAGGIDIQTTLQKQFGPEAGFIAVDPFPNKAGVYRKYLPSTTADRKIFFPNTNDEPLASLMYLNWLSKLDNRKFLQIGKPGVNHEAMPDGSVKVMASKDPAWIQNSGNNIDYTIVINGLDLGNQDLNAKSIALGYPGVDPKYPAAAYTIMRTGGRIVKNYNVGEVKSQAGMDNVLRDKRDNFLTQSIVASTADFDKVYDAGWADFLKSGGQAIIDERTAKYAEIYGKK